MLDIYMEAPDNDYSWLLSKNNIKEDYVRLYLENYIYILFNLISNSDWYRNDSNLLCLVYDLEDSSEYGDIKDLVDSSSKYTISKDRGSTDVYYDKVYSSTDSDIPHTINLIGDLEDYKYKLILTLREDIEELLPDERLIELYKEDNEILMELLSSKKGE